MICVHGSLDRVKDVSPSRRGRSCLSRRLRALVNAHADSVPLLGFQRTSDVIGAAVDKGGAPANVTDRSSPPFLRCPAKGNAIQKSGMPFTVVTSACG
jgi:hypothetical protein